VHISVNKVSLCCFFLSRQNNQIGGQKNFTFFCMERTSDLLIIFAEYPSFRKYKMRQGPSADCLLPPEGA
jgi:hypothetical protein